MTDEPIPQADPRAGFLALRTRIDIAITQVIESGAYILGSEVSGFEQEFSAFVGVRHGVGVASGTDAIILALKGIGVGPNDYVVTVPHTAVASVAAIELAGAKPLLVDIDPRTYTMDPQALAEVLARPPGRIAAVMPVHIYGQPADLAAIEPMVATAGAVLIEDSAQCHGALWGARMTGSVGRVGTFSFYPTKNLAALGDAGAIVTSDDALAERIRALRQYGWRERYISDITGLNSRLDEVQAAILRVRLTMLEAENQRRRDIAAAYDSGLQGLPIVLPARQPEDYSRLPSIRGAHAQARGAAPRAAIARHRHQHPLPDAGPSAAGLSRPRRHGTRRPRRDRACGARGAEPADVPAAPRGAGRPRHRRHPRRAGGDRLGKRPSPPACGGRGCERSERVRWVSPRAQCWHTSPSRFAGPSLSPLRAERGDTRITPPC